MQDDLPDFLEVIDQTDPFMDGQSEIPDVEVREESREVTRRGAFVSSETRQSYRFYVVDNVAGETLFRGAWSTESHHNPYGQAKARAVGFKQGYKQAREG